MICKMKVLTLSFHLNQWGTSTVLGTPRNAYLTADYRTLNLGAADLGGNLVLFGPFRA